MKNNLEVLLVEDSEDDALLIKRELKKADFKPEIKRVETKKNMQEALKKQAWDVVISDYVLPKFSGLDALNTLKKSKKIIPFIVVSGKIGEDTAVQAMKKGADDYIMKNNLKRLPPAIRRELEDVKIRKERKKAKENEKKYYKQLEKEVENRKKAEENAVESKKYLQNVINSASEIIIAVGKNNRISIWNKTAEKITGYKKDEVDNRSINKIDLFVDPQQILDVIKNTNSKSKKNHYDIVIRTKEKAKKIIRFTASAIRDKKRKKTGTLFIGKDISKDVEIHGKLLEGNSYLIADKKIDSGLDLFNDLVVSDYHGLYITRSNPEMIKSLELPSKAETVLLSNNNFDNIKNISNLDDLEDVIQKFTKKKKDNLILFDGVHYLMSRFSFEDFMDKLYDINEIIAKKGAIMLLKIDPDLLDKKQMAIIENELKILPSQKVEGITLEDSVYKMLKYIYEQNQQNALVPYKKIMNQFNIAYSTAAKRLESLEEKDLIYSKRQGKLRTVFISEKGKTLLHKREAA